MHHNGCHAILDTHDNISDHWVARLRGDTTKSVVVETCNLRRVIDDEFPLDEFCCDTQWNPIDEICPTQTGKNDSDEPDFPKLFQGLTLELPHTQPCTGTNPFMNRMLSRATYCSILQERTSLGTTVGLKLHGPINASFNVLRLPFLVFQCHCCTWWPHVFHVTSTFNPLCIHGLFLSRHP